MRTCPQPVVVNTLTALQLENSRQESNKHREVVICYQKLARMEDFKIP